MPKSILPLEPLPGHVVLKEYKIDQKIAGRLYMPSDAQASLSIGQVIEIGGPLIIDEKVHIEEPEIERGDIMAYQNYGGQEIQLEGQKYFLVPFDKLLAKVNIKES